MICNIYPNMYFDEKIRYCQNARNGRTMLALLLTHNCLKPTTRYTFTFSLDKETRLRPPFLASYIASSAMPINCSGEDNNSVFMVATPRLTVTFFEILDAECGMASASTSFRILSARADSSFQVSIREQNNKLFTSISCSTVSYTADHCF